jgi:hypothetical protein
MDFPPWAGHRGFAAIGDAIDWLIAQRADGKAHIRGFDSRLGL